MLGSSDYTHAWKGKTMRKYRPMKKTYYDMKRKVADTEVVRQRRIESESTIVLDFCIGEYPAFVVYCDELMAGIERFSHADKKMTELVYRLPGLAVWAYIRKQLVEEMQQSNEIENVRSTRKEIQDAIETNARRDTRFRKMAHKYIALIEKQNIPLQTNADIRQLYDDFMLDEVLREDPANAPDGKIYRKTPVQVYSNGEKMIHEGVFPESKIENMMGKALAFLHDESYHTLIRVASFHYLFAYIHPFYDGNGRMTRFISSYMANQQFDTLLAIGMSTTIKKHRKEYYRLFADTNDKHNYGDMTAFVIAFIQWMQETAEGIAEKLHDITNQLESYKQRCEALHLSQTLENTLWILIQQTICSDYGLSKQTLREHLDKSHATIDKQLNQLAPYIHMQKDGRKYTYLANLTALDRVEVHASS